MEQLTVAQRLYDAFLTDRGIIAHMEAGSEYWQDLREECLAICREIASEYSDRDSMPVDLAKNLIMCMEQVTRKIGVSDSYAYFHYDFTRALGALAGN